MDYQNLRNYGKLYTAKASPRVMMSSFASIPRELGFLGTPKFVAKLQGKERQWKKKDFKSGEERGFTHAEFLDAIKYSVGFYTALIATVGKEKTLEVYPKLNDKLGTMMYEEFLPSSEDFHRCRDPWEAFRLYFLEFLRVYERDKGMRLEILQNTEDELHIHVTDCVWEFIFREAGYPELASFGGHTELLAITSLAQAVGGDLKREACLCKGDAFCDWHFYRCDECQ
jgi:hypothetical protein